MQLIGDVDEKMLEKVLEELDENDPFIYLSTMGGASTVALGIYDLIRDRHPSVTIVAVGAVDSAGVLIFMAGKERWMYPNARLLLHSARIHFHEEEMMKIGDLRAYTRQVEWSDRQYATIISQRSNLGYSSVLALAQEEHAFEGRRALSAGLVHRIVGEEEEVGSVSLSG